MINANVGKSNAKFKLAKENGITLIALVITVIVLLILAGAAVSIAVKSESVFERANRAKEDWNEKTATEKSAIQRYLDYLDTSTTICFGGKTLENVIAGDDMTIGIKATRSANPEKFKIIKKEGNIITAIPYYNITLEDHPVQYWLSRDTYLSSREVNFSNGLVDLTSEGLVPPQYIEAYKNTLEALGAKNVSTRMAYYNDLKNLDGLMRNPSGIGNYWLRSIDKSGGTTYIECINESGTIIRQSKYISNEYRS